MTSRLYGLSLRDTIQKILSGARQHCQVDFSLVPDAAYLSFSKTLLGMLCSGSVEYRSDYFRTFHSRRRRVHELFFIADKTFTSSCRLVLSPICPDGAGVRTNTLLSKAV